MLFDKLESGESFTVSGIADGIVASGAVSGAHDRRLRAGIHDVARGRITAFVSNAEGGFSG